MLNRLSIPVISDKAVQELLRFLKIDVLNKDCNMFEVGYRQCQEDVAKILAKHSGVDTTSNVEALLREVRRRADDTDD